MIAYSPATQVRAATLQQSFIDKGFDSGAAPGICPRLGDRSLSVRCRSALNLFTAE